jgi:hypothetical protein
MLDTSASLWLGTMFVLVGAINAWLILQASSRIGDMNASRLLIAAHRTGGYLFIALFSVMVYFMVARLGDMGGGPSPGSMIHGTLAMILSPLLFVKVLVARYYKKLLFIPDADRASHIRAVIRAHRHHRGSIARTSKQDANRLA